MYMYIVLSLQLCDKVAMLGTGYKVQGRGGWLWKFFLSTGFQWPTPELFDKIGAAHPLSGTEKTSDPPP